MLKTLWLKIKSSDFAKNSLTLSAGVALAQVLPFLFYPLLGRIFTAEEFGLLATLTSITSVLAVLGSGKYESGILIADNKLEAANLAVLSVCLGAVVMLLSWLLMQFVLLQPLTAMLHEPDLPRWIYVCPVAAFSIIVFNVYNEWCVREKYFKALSVNKIVNSSAIALSKTFLGFVRLSSQGLVVGDLAGRIISAVGCAVRALLKDGHTFFQVTWRGMRSCAAKFKEFPIFTMPGQLLNTLGQAFPILLIGAFFNKTEVGYFSMAMTLFAIPINIISTALRDVYRQRANEEIRTQGHCIASFDRLLALLVLTGVGACLLLVWFLPQLMTLFLGPQWTVAGHYAQILAPAMVLSFIAGPLSGIFFVTDKLRQFFYWQVLYAVTTLVSVLLGGWYFGTMEATLILFSAFRGLTYLASILMTRHYARPA